MVDQDLAWKIKQFLPFDMKIPGNKLKLLMQLDTLLPIVLGALGCSREYACAVEGWED